MNSITMEQTVGEVSIKVTASSEKFDLGILTTAVLEMLKTHEQESREETHGGIVFNVVVTKPEPVVMTRDQKVIYLHRMVDWGYTPYYGTVDFNRLDDKSLDVEVDCAEHWENKTVDNAPVTSDRPKGAHCGSITKAEDVAAEKAAAAARQDAITSDVALYVGEIRNFANKLMDAHHPSTETIKIVEQLIQFAIGRHRQSTEYLYQRKDEVAKLRNQNSHLTSEVLNKNDTIDSATVSIQGLNNELRAVVAQCRSESDSAHHFKMLSRKKEDIIKKLQSDYDQQATTAKALLAEKEELLRRLNVIRNFLDSIGHVI